MACLALPWCLVGYCVLPSPLVGFPRGLGSVVVDVLVLDLVWLGRFIPGWFGFALTRLAGLSVVCLGFSFRQLELFDVGQLVLGSMCHVILSGLGRSA